MSAFEAVCTLADLATFDAAEVLAGYLEHRTGDPEPGLNRGRAYWHGWCNRARDRGDLPPNAASAQLAREYVARQREGATGARRSRTETEEALSQGRHE